MERRFSEQNNPLAQRLALLQRRLEARESAAHEQPERGGAAPARAATPQDTYR
jgi:hypothetical protein